MLGNSIFGIHPDLARKRKVSHLVVDQLDVVKKHNIRGGLSFNDVDVDLAANSSAITTLQTNVSTNTSAISTLNSNVQTLQDSLQLTAWKDQCKYATTTNHASLATLTTVQSQALATGNRVLVRAQTATAENGIYVFNGTGLERAADANLASELSGATVMISAADPTLAGYIYYESLVITTLGTSPVTFANIGTGSPLAVATIGSTPNAAGAIVTGSSIALQPASGSFGGVVTTGTQTFMGVKTFISPASTDNNVVFDNTTSGFDSALILNNAGAQKWKMRNRGTTNDMQITNSTGANVITCMSNGNVGIGTSIANYLLDLGLAGSLKGVIALNGNTSGTVVLQPTSAAGNWTLTLPNSAGTANQVLSTDGAGVTSWVSNGVTTLAAIGSSTNANGMTISGNTINLEPASNSFGGIVTTGSQTFAGVKSFSSNVSVAGSITGTPNSPALWAGSTGTLALGSTSTSSTAVSVPCGTMQVGVTSSVRGVLKLFGTSGVVTVQPATAAGTWTLTLPTDDGTSGQVLTTDGNGVCTWVTPTAAPTQYIKAMIVFKKFDDGSITTQKSMNCSVASVSEGTVDITLSPALADTNYLVSMSGARESGGSFQELIYCINDTSLARTTSVFRVTSRNNDTGGTSKNGNMYNNIIVYEIP